jgi:hypothetical protein
MMRSRIAAIGTSPETFSMNASMAAGMSPRIPHHRWRGRGMIGLARSSAPHPRDLCRSQRAARTFNANPPRSPLSRPVFLGRPRRHTTAHPDAQCSRHDRLPSSDPDRLSLLNCSHDPLVERGVPLGRPATGAWHLISRQWRPKCAGRGRLAGEGDAAPSAELLTALAHSSFTDPQVRQAKASGAPHSGQKRRPSRF